jgi:hypothetical protein
MHDEDEIEDEIPEEWIAECREQIALYLATQGVQYGAIGEVPSGRCIPTLRYGLSKAAKRRAGWGGG